MRQSLEIITCDGCGVCCLELGLPPFLGSEIYDLPSSLREEVLEEIKTNSNREEMKVPCSWYDQVKKQCKNYEYRPILCKDFEMGSESCKNFRDFYNIPIL